ncbi:MAG: ATP synthase F1 subunit epsilon [Alphaproteobacteria bacterium]|nr:ATP synthase F1 subunit epsilon [Alphaproteobacteria bacterium]
MADFVQVDLVTPERLFASVEATLVEVPGSEGDFGVLPGHAPLISAIRPGVVTIHLVGGAKQRFVVIGGMAEVTTERCTILGEYLEEVTDVTRDQATARLADARKALADALSDEAIALAEKQVQVAESLALAA